MTSYYVLNSHDTVRLCLGKSEANAPQSDTHRSCQKMWKKLGQTWLTSRITYANKGDWTAPHAPKDSEQCTYLFDFIFFLNSHTYLICTYICKAGPFWRNQCHVRNQFADLDRSSAPIFGKGCPSQFASGIRQAHPHKFTDPYYSGVNRDLTSTLPILQSIFTKIC